MCRVIEKTRHGVARSQQRHRPSVRRDFRSAHRSFVPAPQRRAFAGCYTAAMPDTIYQKPRPAGRKGETVVTSTCGHNCGGRCVVNAHVVDDRIVRISTDPARWQPELPPLHACARGVGQIERALSHGPAEIPRCAAPGRAARASSSASPGTRRWTTSPSEMLRIRDALRQRRHPRRLALRQHLGAARLRGVAKRFFYKFGGCTELWSNMSAEAEIFAVRMTFGAKADYKSAGREPTDYVNSKLILMWGWSPADGTFGTGTCSISRRRRRRACASSASIRAAPAPAGAGRRAHLHQAVDRCRRADRHGLRDRERGPARPGLSATAMCWASTRRICRRARRPAPPTVLPAGRERRRAEDAGMGGRASPASRPRPSAGWRSSSPPPSPRPCSAATRPAARPSASSSTAPPMRWPRSPAMSASSAAIPASATAPPAAPASRACRPAQPDRRQGLHAAAGRPAGPRQGRRLPGRHQDDLFGGRRSLQPVPQRQQDRAARSTAWSSSWRRTIS